MTETEYNLIAAIKKNDLELIKTMKFDPDTNWEYSYTPLMVAADRGFLSIVRHLVLDRKMDVHYANPSTTALTLAVLNSHFETVKFLREQMGNINLAPYVGHAKDIMRLRYPQDESIFSSAYIKPSTHNRIFRYLNNLKKHRERKFIAAVKNTNWEMVKYWIEAEVDINARNKHGRTALEWAVLKRWVHTTVFLLKKGADVGSDRALMYAISMGNRKIVEAMFLYSQTNINIDMQDDRGDTLLMLAIRYEYECPTYEIFDILIKHNPNVNIRNEEGETALSLALIRKCPAICNCLLLHPDILVSMRIGSNSTPLIFYGVWGRNLTILETLINKGCSIEDRDNCGRNALFIAVYEDIKIVEYLLEQGANINVIDTDGNTILHAAVYSFAFEMVELFANKLDKTTFLKKNKNGQAALDLAESLCFSEAKKLLHEINDRYMEE